VAIELCKERCGSLREVSVAEGVIELRQDAETDDGEGLLGRQAAQEGGSRGVRGGFLVLARAGAYGGVCCWAPQGRRLLPMGCRATRARVVFCVTAVRAGVVIVNNDVMGRGGRLVTSCLLG
jgi:hypothetical protein